MKRYLTIAFLSLSGGLQAQQPFDGPYVRYQNGQVWVTTVMKDDDMLIPKTVIHHSKNNLTLDVVPEGRPDWVFAVKLRDTFTNDSAIFPQAGKCLFISDIEGEFSNFRKLLIAAKVIDEHYNWTFDSNTLVIPGDLFDRGKDVVPELWLLYKLEDEAKAFRGRAIVLNGNHDIMNLSGDHRYTEGKYFKDAWLMKMDINGLFDKNTELGRWLRSKNVIDKVGDVLIMHGGLSPPIQQKQLSIGQLNTLCRPWYDAQRKQMPNSVQVFFGGDALFWYRGYFIAPKATAGLIDSTLNQYQCKYIVVGHTIVKWNIASYYGGKVIGIDVDEHDGHTEAALYKNGKWFVVDDQGNSRPLIYKLSNDQITDRDVL